MVTFCMLENVFLFTFSWEFSLFVLFVGNFTIVENFQNSSTTPPTPPTTSIWSQILLDRYLKTISTSTHAQFTWKKGISFSTCSKNFCNVGQSGWLQRNLPKKIFLKLCNFILQITPHDKTKKKEHHERTEWNTSKTLFQTGCFLLRKIQYWKQKD